MDIFQRKSEPWDNKLSQVVRGNYSANHDSPKRYAGNYRGNIGETRRHRSGASLLEINRLAAEGSRSSHMKRWLLLCAAVFLGGASAADTPKVIKHITIYRQAGRYGGWPANHGVWSWGDEIVVGFSAAYYQWIGPDRHPYDRSKPEEPYLAHTADGGETWAIEPAPSLASPEGMYTASGEGRKASELTEAIDFLRPGFCMTFRSTDAQKGRSWFFYSYDRVKTWKGPFDFTILGQKAIMPRTVYLVNGQRDAMIFLTSAKAAGGEGRTFM